MSEEIVKKEAGALVSMADMAKFGGAGFEEMTAKDVAIPFTAIIQSLSPQRKNGHAKFIKGCEEGDIFNTVSGEIVKNDVGIRVVPCYYQKKWVEWKTRESGGGFVQQHDKEDILNQTKKNPDNNRDMLPNGNIIVTTAYHYVIIVHKDGHLERSVIGMTSTNLKKSRKWNSIMQGLSIPTSTGRVKAPMFSHIYPLSTVMESKGNMSWYTWDVGSPELINTQSLFDEAVNFHKAIASGAVKAAEPQSDTESAGEDHSENKSF